MPTHDTLRVDDTRIVQLIVFHVGDEEFGVPIKEVREIIKAGAVTPVPDAPDFIRGLINVRGDIVATIDLRVRFGLRMTPASATDAKHTIITRQQENLFGLMVDEVTEVLRVPETDIKQAPKLITTLHDDYVIGVLPLDDRLIVLLDLARVLSEEELLRLTHLSRSVSTSPEETAARATDDDGDDNEPVSAAVNARQRSAGVAAFAMSTQEIQS